MELVLDVETTMTPSKEWSEGNSLLSDSSPSPYLATNKLVSVSYKRIDSGTYSWIDGESKQHLIDTLEQTDLLIGFNIKFDLSWLQESGFTYEKNIYDVQLAEYVIQGGVLVAPSLNEVAGMYGLPLKHDTVKEYWKKGINTDMIPLSILLEYGEHDVWLTQQIYIKQQEILNGTAPSYRAYK